MPDINKSTILIVDDTENNIYALKEMLANSDRNIIGANSGNQALKILLNQTVDLIILDVQMPEMDGFEAAQIIKSNRKTRDIPIIFATAEKKGHSFMMKGFEEGAIDYLHKPLDRNITEAKVSVLLTLQAQKRELMHKNASLEKFALLISNSPDIICIINADTLQFEEVNEATMNTLGYTREALMGTSLPDYLAPACRTKVVALVAEKLQKFSFETEIYHRSGEGRWLQWNVVNKEGLWFAGARDITVAKHSEEEIKQLNLSLKQNVQQLETVNKELDSFCYSISHDLQAPLRSVSSYATLMLEDYHAQFDEEQKRLMGEILNGANHMSQLINDLLSFSQTTKAELVKKNVDMSELVARIIREMGLQTRKNLEVKLHDVRPAWGDYKLLYQVFFNLISNAVKYSSKNQAAVVEIASSQSDNEVIYCVKDNGTGFSMKYAHKLFNVFQRLHSPKQFEGTGVGLAIVQRIVVRHGGRVWARSEEGKGATFFFSLPTTPQNVM